MNLPSFFFTTVLKYSFASFSLLIFVCQSITPSVHASQARFVKNPILEHYTRKLSQALADPTTDWRTLHGGHDQPFRLKKLPPYQHGNWKERMALGTLVNPNFRKAAVQELDAKLKKIYYLTIEAILTKDDFDLFRKEITTEVAKIDQAKTPQLVAYVQDLNVDNKIDAFVFGDRGIRAPNAKNHGGLVTTDNGKVISDSKGIPLGFNAFRLTGDGNKKRIATSPIQHQIATRDLSNIIIQRKIGEKIVGGQRSFHRILQPPHHLDDPGKKQWLKDHALMAYVQREADNILSGKSAHLLKGSAEKQLKQIIDPSHVDPILTDQRALKYPQSFRPLYGALEAEPCGTSCFRTSAPAYVAATVNTANEHTTIAQGISSFTMGWDDFRLPGLQAGNGPVDRETGLKWLSEQEQFYKENKLKILETDAVAQLYHMSLLAENLPVSLRDVIHRHVGTKESLVAVTTDHDWTVAANRFAQLDINELKQTLRAAKKQLPQSQWTPSQRQTYNALLENTVFQRPVHKNIPFSGKGLLNHQFAFAQKRYRKALTEQAPRGRSKIQKHREVLE